MVLLKIFISLILRAQKQFLKILLATINSAFIDKFKLFPQDIFAADSFPKEIKDFVDSDPQDKKVFSRKTALKVIEQDFLQ